MNYGRDHRSARVYFVVLKAGVVQKCWCKCDTLEHRDSGKRCKDFESKSTTLFQHETSSLFDAAGPWNIFATSAPMGSSALPSAPGVLSSFSQDAVAAPVADTDVDAFSALSNGSVFVRELKHRLPSFFDYSKQGSITAVARAQRFMSKP